MGPPSLPIHTLTSSYHLYIPPQSACSKYEKIRENRRSIGLRKKKKIIGI